LASVAIPKIRLSLFYRFLVGLAYLFIPKQNIHLVNSARKLERYVVVLADRSASVFADVEGFIEKLKLERPLLVGHSMGGFAAMGYAIRHAASMAGLVLVDIAPEISMQGSLKIRDFIRMDREMDSVEDFVERALKFNPMRNRELLRRSLLHNLRQLPSGRWAWKHDPNRMPKDFENERDERKTMIMEQIWSYSIDPQTNVVDVLVCRLRNKIDKSFPEKMIRTVRGIGYVLEAR